MTSSLFNDDWSFRPKVSAFAELGGAGGEWTDVTLPHDAQLSMTRQPELPNGAASGYFAGGAFEYRRDLVVPAEDRGKLVALEFDGVYRDAMVYVNGALAGQHAFGYSRFTVRIDPHLRFGEVNSLRVECRTHQDSRWYTGAGIYRDVRLIVKDAVHLAIDGVRITTPDIEHDRAVVEIAAEVENFGPVSTTVMLESAVDEEGLAEVAGDRSPVTLLPGERVTVRHRLFVPRPALWSVDTPSLYAARLKLTDGDTVLDEEIVTFGIRSLQVDPQKGLRINGEQVKLRGACIHHDNGPLGSASIARAEERRIELLKEAGFNAVRSAHNPISSALLDACDRLGMLVMDETFDMWTSSKSDFDYAFDFPEWWERDIESLVAKDFNHPSVILYSIGNEIPELGSPTGGSWSRRLAEKVRSLDETRFVTNGINGFVAVLDMVMAGMRQQREAIGATSEVSGGGVNAMMTQVGAMMNQISASPQVSERTAESFSVLDVAGMNYGDGRYELDRALFPNRVIVGTETFPGNIAHNWALVRANRHVIGDFTWTGWDYLGEAGIGGVGYGTDGATTAKPYPWLAAWTGDIDITGQRRPVSYYRETVVGLRTEPYLAVLRPEHFGETPLATPWSWSDAIASWTWEGFEGKPIRVEVYSDADEVELLLNGVAVGRSAVGAELAFRADFELAYEPGALVAVAYANGVEQGRSTLTTAAPDTVVLVAEADRAEVRADTTDLAFVAITLTDGSGNLHSGRDRSVTVTVDGAGILQGLASADPATEEPFSASQCRTFDGRALAVVRPTGPGEITVQVNDGSGATASVVLRALRAEDAANQVHAALPASSVPSH